MVLDKKFKNWPFPTVWTVLAQYKVQRVNVLKAERQSSKVRGLGLFSSHFMAFLRTNLLAEKI